MGISVRTKKGITTARVGVRSGFETLVKRKRDSKAIMSNPRLYAHLVEYGTSRSKAKPFIRPAVDANMGNMIELMKVGMEKAVTRAANKLKK